MAATFSHSSHEAVGTIKGLTSHGIEDDVPIAENSLDPTQSHLVPSDGFDTHVHVFDSNLGPYHPSRAYTPEEAPLDELLQFLTQVNSSGSPTNVVLVQPSPYRADNTVLLASLKKLRTRDDMVARGIAVVDLNTVTDAELWHMHDLAVRGIRLNLQADGRGENIQKLKEQLRVAGDKLSSMPGWKIQVFCSASAWDHIHDAIIDLPVEIIADHMGGLKGVSKLGGHTDFNDALYQPGMQSLLDLAKRSKVFVKVTGFYRASTRSKCMYDDLEPIIRELGRQVPERLIWGSDWPHTGNAVDRAQNVKEFGIEAREKFQKIDDERILKQIYGWIGGQENWRRLMADNPRRVFF